MKKKNQLCALFFLPILFFNIQVACANWDCEAQTCYYTGGTKNCGPLSICYGINSILYCVGGATCINYGSPMPDCKYSPGHCEQRDFPSDLNWTWQNDKLTGNGVFSPELLQR